MIERIIIAGSGGQGIMLMGKILAQAALEEDKKTSWIPAYGAEVRGGTAHCTVVISDREIASPFIEKADTLIIMNKPCLEKFKDKIVKKGLMMINSSLVKNASSLILKDGQRIHKFYAPFTDIAVALGNIRVANTVALGAYIAQKKIISAKTVLKVIKEIAPDDKKDLIEINKEALLAGMKLKTV